MEKIVNQNQTLDFPVCGGKAEPSIFLTTKLVRKIEPFNLLARKDGISVRILPTALPGQRGRSVCTNFLFFLF